MQGPSGGNAGSPGAGGGGGEGITADHGGNGGDGKVILTYTSSASSSGKTVQDLTYTYDALGNITLRCIAKLFLEDHLLHL